MASALYDFDLAAWARGSAAMLREGAELDDVLRSQIAEELEGMAKNDRRERDNRTIVLMMHLLKLRFQPEKRTRGWDLTVAVQRDEIETLLRESPSLKRGYREKLSKLYSRAKKLVKIETGLDVFPEENPFSLDEILNG